MFDIVISLGPYDTNLHDLHISINSRNIVGYRNIYVITDWSGNLHKSCIKVPESVFPFSLSSVADIHGPSSRNGWYLQQLFKLYAGLVIPGILHRYLVVDADTFFLRPMIFENSDGKPLYNFMLKRDVHLPYFQHMSTVDARLKRANSRMSGICHHMLFDTAIVKEIFGNAKPFWRIFLESVHPDQYLYSGASEYEMYFNFVLLFHKNDVVLRSLKSKDVSVLDTSLNYDYISYHNYLRSKQSEM